MNEAQPETMSIAKALTELKMLDKRITRRIDNALFIDVRQNSEDKTISGLSVKDSTERIQTDYQSVRALIDRRNQIKMMIVGSNATTKVRIGQKDFTVAEAIERKNSIDYDQRILDNLRHNVARAKSKTEQLNDSVENTLNTLLGDQMKSESKEKTTTTIEFIEQYRKLNGFAMLDPIGAEKLIEKLAEEIEDFELNVDVALSESNARTEIAL